MIGNSFSDRELGMRPIITDEVPQTVWAGIVTEISSRIANGSFGYKFPEECPDWNGTVCGCDERAMGMSLQAMIPGIDWPLDPHARLSTPMIMDVIEFCFASVAEPQPYDWHSYFRHDHLNFDAETGKKAFREIINQILSRNGLMYELGTDGKILRIGDDVIRSVMDLPALRTGDEMLDDLLATARTKFLCADPSVHHEALEKLWDAWERLKTVEPGKNKKESANRILDKAASEPKFRLRIEAEAMELTNIGNNFHIRHAEVTQTPIQRVEQVDYLFFRMYALILLLLRMSSRM